jgi:glucosamine kinase
MLVSEAAAAAVSIIDALRVAGAPTVSLIGGLAEPLLPWLPPQVRDFITQPQSDSADGAILMARRAFFKLDSVMMRAG